MSSTMPLPVISDGLPSQLPDTDPAETPRVGRLAPRRRGAARSLPCAVALRRHFGVDAESVVAVALGELAATGHVKPEVVADAVRRYRLDDPTFHPAGGDA